MAVKHGETYKVKSPPKSNRRVYGQGPRPDHVKVSMTDSSGKQITVKDYYGDVVQASDYVDYPKGASDGYRHVDYIAENLERFDKIEDAPSDEE